MKNVVVFLLIFIVAACNQGNKRTVGGKPRIQFPKTEFDFGEAIMGEKLSHRFEFKNVGNGDLLIDNIITSCGCTVANYVKKPISPNEESFIEVTFDSEGYRGLQMKEVEVYSNCDSSKTTLKLWAKINESKE